MSKRINVNPDHYKGAGRERPGDALPRAPKQPRGTDEEELRRWELRQNRRRKEEGTRKKKG
jgi:hypothetical protein